MKNYLFLLLLFFITACGTYKKSEIISSSCYPDSYLDGDRDNDGVNNRLDQCPNTTKNVTVDSHGCPKDTDGDGVADYKDYQLITPTECQPVDSLGVGVCPDYCESQTQVICGFHFQSEWVGFSYLSYSLDKDAINALERFANQMLRNPSFTAQIIAYGSRTPEQRQVAWSRIKAIQQIFLKKYGIDKNNFILTYGSEGKDYLVQLKSPEMKEFLSKNELGPPPYPDLIDDKNKQVRKLK